MNTEAVPNSEYDAALTELAALGMRGARVVADMMEIEAEAAKVVAGWLPVAGAPASSLGEAVAAGQGVDAVAAAMATALPRIEVLARALDRVSCSVRRQVALGLAAVIRRAAEGEAAERLFDDLAERLDDFGLDEEVAALPVAEVVRRICRDLGVSVERVREIGGGPSGADGAVRGLDTG